MHRAYLLPRHPIIGGTAQLTLRDLSVAATTSGLRHYLDDYWPDARRMELLEDGPRRRCRAARLCRVYVGSTMLTGWSGWQTGSDRSGRRVSPMYGTRS